MDVNLYLSRLGVPGPIHSTIENLRLLHRAHLLAVPFENLDISLGRPIVLNEGRLFEKIISRQRGGFCYELNGLFAALLRELGFQVELLSARVADGKGGFGIEFDHMALLIRLEENWLADVGFGDSFLEPLQLDDREEQVQERVSYRITSEGDDLLYLRKEAGGWQPQYRFSLNPRSLADFESGSHYHQTSPDSSFTRKRVCSRATETGRITLTDRRLIVTANGKRVERLLESEEEVGMALLELFGIVL